MLASTTEDVNALQAADSSPEYVHQTDPSNSQGINKQPFIAAADITLARH